MKLTDEEQRVLDTITSNASFHQSMHLVKVAIMAKLEYSRAVDVCKSLEEKGLVEVDLASREVALTNPTIPTDAEIKGRLIECMRRAKND